VLNKVFEINLVSLILPNFSYQILNKFKGAELPVTHPKNLSYLNYGNLAPDFLWNQIN